MKLLTLKLNVPLNGFPAGKEIKVKSNKGIPLDRFWRDRLKDSEIDDCVTVVKPTRSKTSPKQETK